MLPIRMVRGQLSADDLLLLLRCSQWRQAMLCCTSLMNLAPCYLCPAHGVQDGAGQGSASSQALTTQHIDFFSSSQVETVSFANRLIAHSL